MITQDRSGGRGAGSPISRPRCQMSVQGVRKAPEELANVGHLHLAMSILSVYWMLKNFKNECCMLYSRSCSEVLQIPKTYVE